MVLQQFVMSTIGIYYAAKGSDRQENISQKQVWKTVIRMPVAYGAFAGILFQQCHIPLTPSILNSVSMIGDSSIVIIMLILGMQLSRLKITELDYPKLSFALSVRMLISPLIALSLVYWMPVSPMYKQILILLAAMPTAANTTLLSVQFNTKPELVSSTTFISTLLSLISLPVILSLLGTPVPF
ncbi:MAG: hypothetical protein XXXJIFNMEKO3_02281 [Candidatus Erwinia impunctatus]|nr:hypothetical protein XXXJIFNMEKO_02281 [Culicoides impunctatus]